MKIMITSGVVLLTVLLSASVGAQDNLPQAQKPGFKTQVPGWTIRPGDTLQVGQGSLPDKTFAFLYESGTSAKRPPLPRSHAGQKVIIKEVSTSPSGVAEFSIDQQEYAVNLAKAIDAGEVLPPITYRPSARASPRVPVTNARQLIRLKAMLKAGKITQAEYDRRSKKLLKQS